MAKLSVCLATYNEQDNIGSCLSAVKDVADEIIIVDGQSSDKTVLIAKEYGATVFLEKNQSNFHINKQKAINKASGDWILQLDADEIVSRELKQEICAVMQMKAWELDSYEALLPEKKLFDRHIKVLEKRDGTIGDPKGEYNAFFIPRLNYFLGKYLQFGGVYPDGVIRFFRKGKAHLPAKDVHEQYTVIGRVGWLRNPLYHKDSPTFKRYLIKNNRYIDFLALQLLDQKTKKDIKTGIIYLLIKPVSWFVSTQIRHKGILDGYHGIIFSFFSALRYPRAYIRFLRKSET